MTKKLTILIIGGIGVVAVVVFVVAVRYKPSGSTERGTGIMGLREAERQVEQLKEKIRVPIDEVTRKRIDGLINDLALAHEYTVEFNGQKYSVAWKAGGDLRRIGKAAVPQLIDAAANHRNPRVRRHVVATIYKAIGAERDVKLLEYLPVFVRSMYDQDLEVRVTAMGHVGNMARLFYRRERHEELEQLIPYLAKALRDKEERMQSVAAGNLFRVGRKDLIPEELIDKYGIGKEW